MARGYIVGRRGAVDELIVVMKASRKDDARKGAEAAIEAQISRLAAEAKATAKASAKAARALMEALMDDSVGEAALLKLEEEADARASEAAEAASRRAAAERARDDGRRCARDTIVAVLQAGVQEAHAPPAPRPSRLARWPRCPRASTRHARRSTSRRRARQRLRVEQILLRASGGQRSTT